MKEFSFARVSIRAGGVTSSLKSAAAEVMTESVLPTFIDWLSEILALPDRSPLLHGSIYFNANYTENGITIAYLPK
jgi:hypothetical protein